MSSLAYTLDHWSLHQLSLARFREFAREKEAIFWTFVFPVLMAVGLGIAFRNKGPDKVYVGVVTGASQSATIGTALAHQPDVVVRQLTPAQVDGALRRGDVALVVEPATQGTGASYRFDPTRAESRVAQLVADQAMRSVSGLPPAPPARLEKVTQRGSRYIDFLIPGLLGMNLLGTGLWGVGFAIVRMRTGKLLKRLLATPMHRSEFLLSFLLARLVFLFIEVTVLLIFARVVFDVVVNGSVVALYLVAVLGALTFGGIGLLVASRARTEEGVMGLMNVVSLPMWILSGVFFSADRFPALLQPLIRALPLTAVVDSLRGIMVDGASLAALALPLGTAVAWGIASYATALAIFRWK